jgi:hypothetical protein
MAIDFTNALQTIDALFEQNPEEEKDKEEVAVVESEEVLNTNDEAVQEEIVEEEQNIWSPEILFTPTEKVGLSKKTGGFGTPEFGKRVRNKIAKDEYEEYTSIAKPEEIITKNGFDYKYDTNGNYYYKPENSDEEWKTYENKESEGNLALAGEFGHFDYDEYKKIKEHNKKVKESGEKLLKGIDKKDHYNIAEILPGIDKSKIDNIRKTLGDNTEEYRNYVTSLENAENVINYINQLDEKDIEKPPLSVKDITGAAVFVNLPLGLESAWEGIKGTSIDLLRKMAGEDATDFLLTTNSDAIAFIDPENGEKVLFSENPTRWKELNRLNMRTDTEIEMVYGESEEKVGEDTEKYILEKFKESKNLAASKIDIGEIVKEFNIKDPLNIKLSQGKELYGGILNAFVGLTETAIPALFTRGASLLPQIGAPMYIDYNIEKANRLYGDDEDPLGKLIANNETDVAIPITMAVGATGLEYIGLKGIYNQMLRKTGSWGPFAGLLLTQNQEGLTEVGQLGFEEMNTSLAKGMSLEDSVGASINKMFSKEGLENYLMGVIASGGLAAPSTFSQMLITDGDNLNKVQNYIDEISKLQVQKSMSNNQSFKKAMDIEIESLDNSFKEFLNNTTNLANILTQEEQADITNFIDQKRENNKTIKELEASYISEDINLNQYRTGKAALINKNKGLSNRINRIVGETRKRFNEEQELAKKEREETVGMGVIPTRRTKKEEVSAEEQADLNQINIDLYKENTDETTRNNAVKDIIEDNAGFFLSDKGGINFDANFKGYINKNTGKPITRQEVLNEINAEIPSIINAFTQDKGANFTTYAGIALNKRLPKILESLIGAKEASKTKEMTAEELAMIPEQKTETQETQGKEFEKRKYPTDVAAIEKQTANVRPEILTNIKNSVKQFIASSVGKVKEIGGKGKKIITKLDPLSLAKELKAQNKATRAAVVAAIGKGKQYKDFVTKVINDGYIETIPIAAMKKRFRTVKGFNIEKIGRETLGAGTGIYKLSGLNKQALIDFYTKDQSGRRSFIDLLSKGLTIEQFQEVKIDPEFIKDLDFKLKEAKSELTAEEFMNEVERIYDGRTKEFASLDDVSNIDKFIDNVLDPVIDQYKGTFSSLNPAAFAQGLKTGLRAYQKAIKDGKTFKESLQKLINSFVNSFKLNSQQKAAFEKGVFEKIKTEAQLMGKTLIEIMQTSGINVIAKYIEGDVTVNSKNRKVRQESVLQSVIKSKIPGQLLELLGLANFGASRQERANGDYYYELDNGEWIIGEPRLDKDGKQRYGKKRKNGTKPKLYSQPTLESIEAAYPGQGVKLKAERGALYYGADDPAYITLMEAANKYNKKKFEKVQRVKIPAGKKLTLADKKANKAQEKINMQALEDLYTILAKRDKDGKLIIPLNDSALLISQSYQGTNALIKIAAPFAGVSQRLIGGQIEEHSPPASSIGAAMIWGIANNQSELIMQGIKDNFIQVQLSISANNKLNAAKLDKTIPDGMSIITPNVGILRLAAAGVNLNTITDLETGKSFADKAGLPLPNEFKSNPSAVKYQNKLLVDIALIPELTLEKAKENLKVSLPTQENKNIQVKNKAKNLAPEFLSEDQTADQQKEVLENSLATQVDAQKINKKKKGISVFDFDDTLAKTKEKVIVYAPAFKPGTSQEVSMELTPAEFAERAQELEGMGASFDFSQFENVKGAKKGPLADLALRRQGKFGSGDIFVLTARPQTSAQGIKTFLDGIGLNIPLENITGLEDGTSQAKADWVLQKTEKGYNDFYFADDAIQNVTAVKQILDQVDVKSKVQQAIADKTINLDKEFNKQIEEVTGKEAYKEYSPARAKLAGRAKDKGFFKWFGKQLTITPSAEDFMGLMYDIIGKGKQGNRHAQFISDNLIKPYNKAEQEILSAKVTVANDFAALKKAFPSLKTKRGKNPLMQEIGVGPYTKSNAIRVYMWDKQGMEIPGLSQRDQAALVAAVEADSELNVFADEVILIQKESNYPPPGNNWTGGDITTDILQGLDKGFRNKLMTEFNENAAIIFSEKNMNKLEAIYGTKWIEALKDSLRRMKVGSNRPVYQGGGSRIVNEMLDWLNGSVGAVMFLNMKSGLLQLISNVNFINWGDNNIYQASKAFASKEYWPTVMKLMNSDYLVNRRDGLKINVNEAELADTAKKNGMKGAIAYLLDKGFIITRIMDSLAIATGGATFYINRRNALLKRQNPETGKKYTQAEAEAKAFDDFYAIAEDSQQSSNPSKISQQQASLAGRVILSFQNVTMQYNRMTKKAIRTLWNRRKTPGMTQRESDMSNLSKIIYYTTIQNLIFNALQQAIFAVAFDDEGEEEEKDKTADIANGMLDSLLFGLGFGGAAISTVKSVLLKVMEEHEKKSPDYEEAVWEIFNISPVLDSKVRKLRTAAKTFSWNREEIKNRGWSLDNPAYLAVSQMISAATNIPIDRVLRKSMNVRQAMDEETRTWQRVALILGWTGWSLGLPYWGLQSTIKREAEQKEKLKVDYKNDIRKLKAQGYKKVMYRNLKDFNSDDIVELQSPAGTVVYYVKTKKKK